MFEFFKTVGSYLFPKITFNVIDNKNTLHATLQKPHHEGYYFSCIDVSFYWFAEGYQSPKFSNEKEMTIDFVKRISTNDQIYDIMKYGFFKPEDDIFFNIIFRFYPCETQRREFLKNQKTHGCHTTLFYVDEKSFKVFRDYIDYSDDDDCYGDDDCEYPCYINVNADGTFTYDASRNDGDVYPHIMIDELISCLTTTYTL